MTLRGHASFSPTFVAGGTCSSALAKQADSLIGTAGFDFAGLDYKLTY
jgi:hypothetical protein